MKVLFYLLLKCLFPLDLKTSIVALILDPFLR